MLTILAFKAGTCWDVSSQKSLKHNGGGDSNAIANMVTYTLKKYNADPKRVFVTGSSSGAMMTVSSSQYDSVHLKEANRP